MASFEQIVDNLSRQAGFAAQQAKEAAQIARGAQGEIALARQAQERMQRDLQNLADAMKNVTGKNIGGGNGNPHVRYIESIPGRRIPFDFMASIVIGSNTISVQQGTRTVSQDGPFVGVARYATFMSAFQFSRIDPTTSQQANFQGRSFGRFRPIHSAWDLNDGQAGYQPTAGLAPPGTGAAIVASASNHSSFRTMQFDGMIKMLNQGAGFPRSNDPIPSAWYSESISSPFQLGALDFFERGETVQWEVTPTHVNNPPAGNLSGYAAGGVWPFLQSQYDVHEGINDPLIAEQTTDPITRLPDGILFIGMHGFRIIQPPGPVALT